MQSYSIEDTADYRPRATKYLQETVNVKIASIVQLTFTLEVGLRYFFHFWGLSGLKQIDPHEKNRWSNMKLNSLTSSIPTTFDFNLIEFNKW